jgi:outer membrane protein assembly factor BamB
VNTAPAIAPDGTIYTASRAHRNSRYSYLVAVNPDLTPKWAASLRDRIADGCGVLVPNATIDNPIQRGHCRYNAPLGVDPQTNQMPAGRILDDGTASPTVLPDGSVIFGGYTRYNIARGHLFKFSSSGSFLAAYDFGWDDTLGVYQHGGTYSIVMKDNHYDEEGGYYCFTPTPVSRGGAPTTRNIVCDYTGIPAGPFYITQVDPNLVPEWKFWNTNTQSCTRNPDGSITCVSDHPGGFEWCTNAPLIDRDGVVYANSEDGNLYAIDQGHGGVFTTPKQKIFQNIAIGAAYTPASMDASGRIYSQNDGHLFVIGTGGRGIGHGGGKGGQGHGAKRPPEGNDPTDE